MTIHEALIVSAACDTDKDDCDKCPLYPELHWEDEERQVHHDSLCRMLERMKLALAHRPFPRKVEAPRAQG